MAHDMSYQNSHFITRWCYTSGQCTFHYILYLQGAAAAAGDWPVPLSMQVEYHFAAYCSAAGAQTLLRRISSSDARLIVRNWARSAERGGREREREGGGSNEKGEMRSGRKRHN